MTKGFQFYQWTVYKGGTPLLDTMNVMRVNTYVGCNSQEGYLAIHDESGKIIRVYLKLGDWIIIKDNLFYKNFSYLPTDQIQ